MSVKTPKRNLFAGVFAVLTVSVMALFFSIYEPWQPIGPELIPDGGFSTPAATNLWSGWNELTQIVPDGGFGGSPGVMLNTEGPRHGPLYFTVRELTGFPALRVVLRATAKDIVRGEKYYYVPRAVLVYYNATEKDITSRHHDLMELHKNSGWRKYKGFFPAPDGAVCARLHVQNLGVAGVMQIDDVSIVPVRERFDAPWWKLFFGTLWTTAFGLCLFAMRPWVRRYGFLIMMTLALIMTGIVLPGKFLDDSIEKYTHAARSLRPETVVPAPPAKTVKASPEQPATPKAPKPKENPIIVLPGINIGRVHAIGHFALFSLLAFLSALSWISAPYSLRRAAAVFAGLAFFAAATEVLQFIPPDRSAGLSDLSIDVFGMAGAVVLILLLRGAQRLITRYKH